MEIIIHDTYYPVKVLFIVSVLLRGQESGQVHRNNEWGTKKLILSFRKELNDHETVANETLGKLAWQQPTHAQFPLALR